MCVSASIPLWMRWAVVAPVVLALFEVHLVCVDASILGEPGDVGLDDRPAPLLAGGTSRWTAPAAPQAQDASHTAETTALQKRSSHNFMSPLDLETSMHRQSSFGISDLVPAPARSPQHVKQKRLDVHQDPLLMGKKRGNPLVGLGRGTPFVRVGTSSISDVSWDTPWQISEPTADLSSHSHGCPNETIPAGSETSPGELVAATNRTCSYRVQPRREYGAEFHPLLTKDAFEVDSQDGCRAICARSSSKCLQVKRWTMYLPQVESVSCVEDSLSHGWRPAGRICKCSNPALSELDRCSVAAPACALQNWACSWNEEMEYCEALIEGSHVFWFALLGTVAVGCLAIFACVQCATRIRSGTCCVFRSDPDGHSAPNSESTNSVSHIFQQQQFPNGAGSGFVMNPPLEASALRTRHSSAITLPESFRRLSMRQLSPVLGAGAMQGGTPSGSLISIQRALNLASPFRFVRWSDNPPAYSPPPEYPGAFFDDENIDKTHKPENLL